MIRIFIESLILFMLPAALYISFALLTRRENASGTAIINRAPVLALALLGASLVALVFSLFGHSGDGKPGQAYEPATFKDGKIVPGRMK